jgi:hypothetical protein
MAATQVQLEGGVDGVKLADGVAVARLVHDPEEHMIPKSR